MEKVVTYCPDCPVVIKKKNFDNSQNIILKKYIFLYIYSSENILIWILDLCDLF